MRFLEIPALITEDIETPDIVDITEPISASISGTTLTIDGGNKVSGESTITLTGDVTVNTINKSNLREPSIHKISVKTNGKGNFTYTPNTGVTASSVSSTIKTGSDFEILLITTSGGDTYLDLDLADYTSPAVNFDNALTGFDISDLTSAYGATAKLYKPDGTLLSTTSSAKIGSGVGFGGGVETTPVDVTYKLEVTDDLGRKSTYDLPRKWINYAMETSTTPGFQKFKLGANEYTSTIVVPNLSSTTKARVYKTTDHGYLGINFKIQGRNSTSDAWTDIDSTAENVESDESAEFLAFGDYLYQRVWVKPTAKATTIVSSSNVVTLTLSNVTEDVTKTISGKDPYSIDETSNTYVFDEPSRVGTVPFTITLGSETYTDSVSATTEEMGGITTKTFHTQGSHTVDESNILYKHLGISGTTWQVSGSTDGKWITHCDGSGHPHFYKGSPESGYTYTQTKNNGQGSTGTLSYDGLYYIGNSHGNTNATLPILKRTGDTFNDHSSNLTKPSSEQMGPVAWSQNSYNFAITNAITETIYFYEFDSSNETWSTTWNSGSLTSTLGDLSWFGRMSARLSKDGEYLVTADHSPETTRIWKCDWTAQTVTLQHTQTGNSGCAAIDYDGEYVIAGYNSANTKILKRSGTTWTDVTSSEGFNTLPYNRIGAQFLGVPSQYLLTGEYQTPGVSGSYHTFLYKWKEKKETTLTYNGKDKLTIAHKGSITPQSVKLYKDGTLYHTFGAELSVFINETGVYQAISDDTYYSAKVTVTTITETEAQIYMSHRTCFLLKKDGKVWYWGESNNGSNAMGNNTQVPIATLNDNLNALPSGIKQISRAAVDAHCRAAITNDGKLYTWGFNGHGGLGRGNENNSYTSEGPWLVDTQSSNTFTFCHSSYYENFALQDNGYLWACGHGGHYLLGNGSHGNQNRFVRVDLPNVIDFDANHDIALAVTNENKVYIWGRDGDNSMGGATGTTATPTHMTALDGKNIVKVRTAYRTGYVISSDGKVYAWGKNNSGQIPKGSNGNVSTPEEMTWFTRNNVKVVDIKPSHNSSAHLALDDQGNMYVWGSDGDGSIGDYAPSYTYHWPVLLKTNIASITSGYAECGCIDKFGQVYTWGDAQQGQQNWIHGSNSDTDINIPTSNNLSVGSTIVFDGSDRYVLGKDSTVTSEITFGSNTVSLGTKSEVFVTDPHTYKFKIIDTDSVTYTSNVVSTVSRPTGRVYPPKSGTHKSISATGSANVDNTWTIDGALYGNGAYKASMNKNTNAGQDTSAYNAFNGLIGYTHVHTDSGNPTAAFQLHMPQKIKLTKYAMYSRNFTSEYDKAPKDWKVYGSNDSGTTWTELDSQTNQTVTAWGDELDFLDTKREYTVTGNTKYFSSYKLDVTANGGDGNYVILSQIEYYGDEEGFLSDDGYGKLTLDVKGDSLATSNITFHSNTFVMGAARDLYIKDLGEYSVDIYGSSKHFLGSKTHTVSANATEFVWNSNETQVLHPGSVTTEDLFGNAVAFDGNYAIIGSNNNDSGGDNRGMVYIFHKSGGTWTQQASLQSKHIRNTDNFGMSVDISGDYAIVGAYLYDENWPDVASNRGAAYIFKREGTAWRQQTHLQPSDPGADDYFGNNVRISGDYAIVGSPYNDDPSNSGSSYVFKKTSTTLSTVRNPIFTDASTIETNSNWSSSTGFEITSSGDSSTTYSQKWRAFDNTHTGVDAWESTWLSGGGMPAWLQIQYPEDVVIKSYTIVGRDATNRYIPTSWQLQGATAAAPTTYVNLETNNGNRTASSWAPLAEVSHDVNSSNTAYRYFRLYVNSSNEANQVSINQLKLFTTPLSGQSGTVEDSWAQQEKFTASDAASNYEFGLCADLSGDYAIIGANGCDSFKGAAYIFKRNVINWSSSRTYNSLMEIGATVTWGGATVINLSGGTWSSNRRYDLDTSQNSTSPDSRWFELYHTDDNVQGDGGHGLEFRRNGSSTVIYVNTSDNSATPPKLRLDSGTAAESITIDSSDIGSTVNLLNNAETTVVMAFTVTSSLLWTGPTYEWMYDSSQSDINNLQFELSGSTTRGIRFSKQSDGSTLLQVNVGDDTGTPSRVSSTNSLPDVSSVSLTVISGLEVFLWDSSSLIAKLIVPDYCVHPFDTDGGWSQQAKIQASDGATGDRFGKDVALSGDYAIAGAYNDDTATGSAYIFKKNTGAETWSQQQKLIASDGATSDSFGWSVDITGDTAVVGAYYDDSYKGSAYIFERSGTVWTEVKKITASGGAGGNFGNEVFVDGTTVLVGSPVTDTKGTNTGAAYVFEKIPVAVPTLNFDGYNKLSIDNVSSGSGNEWPPTDGTASSFNVTNSNKDAEWTISGASYGNGTYRAKWSATIIDAPRHSGKAFNKVYGANECFHSNGTSAGNLDLEVPEAFILESYDMRHRTSNTTANGNAPRDWVISGSNDGSTWTELDTQSGQVYSPHVPGGGETLRSYTVTGNTTAYKHYRMYISSIDTASSGDHIVIGELRYYAKQTGSNTFTIKKDGAAFATTTSNTVYIRETGTYTAEVKGSGAYVTELSKVVSGSITQKFDYKSTVQKIIPTTDGTVSNDDRYAYVGISGNGLVMVIAGYGDDDGGGDTGGFMVYEKVGGVWTFTQQITGVGSGSSTFGLSEEGKAVQLDYTGTRVFIGAHADDHTHNNSGSVYIYRRIAKGNWTLEQRIDGGGSSYRYGYNDVNNDGDKLLIGSYGYSSNTGRVWYYTRSGTTWTLQDQLAAPDAGGTFGISLGMNSTATRAVIGAYNVHKVYIWNSGPPEFLPPVDSVGTGSNYRRFSSLDTSTHYVYRLWHTLPSIDSSLSWPQNGYEYRHRSSTSTHEIYDIWNTNTNDWYALEGFQGIQVNRATNTWSDHGSYDPVSVRDNGDGTITLVGGYGGVTDIYKFTKPSTFVPATGTIKVSKTDYTDWSDNDTNSNPTSVDTTTYSGKVSLLEGSTEVYRFSVPTDSWSHKATITVDNYFGWNVDMSNDGNTIVVAARGNDKAYIYETTDGGTTWTLTKEYSGYTNIMTVQISGDGTTVVVGDPEGGSSQTGYSYVYIKSNGSWPSSHDKRIDSDSTGAYNGQTVAISDTGDVVSGVFSDDTGGSNHGAVYVYEKEISGPTLTYDGKNKLTIGGTNYADTSKVTKRGGTTYDIGTAKTMYIKETGDYDLEVSGSDMFGLATVNVGSIDLAGATTKPIDFDGYNKLTFVNAGANAVSNVSLNGGAKQDLGSATSYFIKDAGTYTLEMSGSNVFALSSNVVNAISVQTVSGTHRFKFEDGNVTDENNSSISFNSGGSFGAADLRNDGKTSCLISPGSNKTVTIPAMTGSWCINFWMFHPYCTWNGNTGGIPSDFSSYVHAFGYNWHSKLTFHMDNGYEWQLRSHWNWIMHLYESHNSSSTNFDIWLNSLLSSTGRASVHGGNNSDSVFLPEAWHHWAFEYNGTTGGVKLYLDGHHKTTTSGNFGTGNDLTGITWGDNSVHNAHTHNGSNYGSPYPNFYISDIVINTAYDINVYNLTKGTYKHHFSIPAEGMNVRQYRDVGNETSVSSPSLTFDGYNKLTVTNFTTTDQAWPPLDGTLSSFTVTNSNKDAEWTISGASYGNGTYKAKYDKSIHGSHHPGLAFDRIGNVAASEFHSDNNEIGNLSIEFPETVLIDSYEFRDMTPSSSGAGDHSPTDWTFEGSNDGTTWVTLDTQSGFTKADWTASPTQKFTINGNSTAYKHYRASVSAVVTTFLTIREMRFYKNNPRTGTLTDPNGSVHTLGQTQDTFYIRETGDYTLDVQNNDQKAIVTKNVGTISEFDPSSDWTKVIQMGVKHSITADVYGNGYDGNKSNWLNGVGTYNTTSDDNYITTWDRTSVKRFLWRGRDGAWEILFSNDELDNYNTHWNSGDGRHYVPVISGKGTVDLGSGVNGGIIDVSTITHMEVFGYGHSATYYPQMYFLTSGSSSTRVGSFSWMENNYSWDRENMWGTNHQGFEILVSTSDTAGHIIGAGSPSLTFDGFDKLTLTNADSDATSNIDYFSNTYEMGSRKELIISDEGTYYANIHSSNTLALAKKELPYTVLSSMTVSFKYCPGGRTSSSVNDSNQVECYVYNESTGAVTSSTPFKTWGPDNDNSWNDYSGTFTPPSSGNYRLVWKLTTGNHVPDTGWDAITFGGTTWNFETNYDGFKTYTGSTLNVSSAVDFDGERFNRTNSTTENGSYNLIPQRSPQSYYIFYDGSYDNNNNDIVHWIISPIVSSTTETITISGDTPADSATFNLRYTVTGDSESRMPELSIVNGLGTHTWSKTSSFTDINGTEYDWMFIGEESHSSTTAATTVALPYTVSVEVITGSPNSGFTERIWNGRGSSTDNTEQKNCNTVGGIIEIKGTYTSAIAPTYLLVSFTSGAKNDMNNGHLKAIDVIVSGKTYFSIDLGTTYGIAGDLMENYPSDAGNQTLFAIKLPNKLFGLPELKFDGYNKLTPPVLESTFTSVRISDWDNSNSSKTTVTGGGDWPDATMTHHQVLQNGDKSYQHTDGGASRDAAQLFTTVISGDWGNASHGQAIHSPMWFGYKFTEGKKSVSKMILTQPPGNSHTTGNVFIKYWDGSAMVSVNNQSPAAMSSQSYNSSTTFTFDSVSSQYWQIDCYKGSSNSTSYTALHGWQLFSGKESVSTVITKGSDSYDIGTASSFYIDAAGTYDAQAKNSNTFVIKARNTVSGTPIRKQVWNANESQILYGSDPGADDNFGHAIGVDGNYAVVGSRYNDTGGTDRGAAFIFHKSGGTWTEQAMVQPSDASDSDWFGRGAAISGDYVIVNAYAKTTNNTGQGAAYIFKRVHQENPDFTANSTLHTDYTSKYGWDTNSGWVVSAKDHLNASSYPTWKAFNKLYTDNNNWLSGSAPSTSSPQWIQIKYPSAQVIKSYMIRARQNNSPRFPTAWKLQGSVSDGTTWVDIGSEQTESTWVIGTSKTFDVSSNTTAYQYYRLRITGCRESASSSNSDYVAIGQWKLFTGTAQTYWTQEEKLTASDAEASDAFSYSVDINGDYAICGALNEDAGGTSDAGSAYIYKRTGSNWEQQAKIQASDKEAADKFGRSVTISGDYAAVGADQEDTTASNAGSVYIFKKEALGRPTTNVIVLSPDWGSPAQHYHRNPSLDTTTSSFYELVAGTSWGSGTTSDNGHGIELKLNGTNTELHVNSDNNSFDPATVSIGGGTASSSVTLISGQTCTLYKADGTGYSFTVDSGHLFSESWSQQAKIQASNAGADDYFGGGAGQGVSLSGDYLAVGARTEDTGGSQAGSVYIFKKQELGRAWPPSAPSGSFTLTNSNKDAEWTISGAAYGNGTYKAKSNKGVHADGSYYYHVGRMFDYNVSDYYEYHTAGSEWTQSGTVDLDIEFPTSFVLSSYELTIAPYTVSSYAPTAWTILGSNDGTTWSSALDTQTQMSQVGGEIYILTGNTTAYKHYRLSVSSTPANNCVVRELRYYQSSSTDPIVTKWSQQAKLQASDVSANSQFGMAVSLSGDVLAVGANAEDTAASDAGAAYIFERSGTTWTEVKKITASDTQASDYFGEAISTDGTTTFVGAFGEDTKGSAAGAAYVFDKAYVGPTLTYDNTNKLSIAGVTAPTTNLTFGSVTHDIGSAKDVYISEQGTYSFHTNDGDQSLLMSKTVSSDPLNKVPGPLDTVVAFHQGTFSEGGDPYSHGSITAAATAGYVYSDTAAGTYTWGTLTSATNTASTGTPQGENFIAAYTTYSWTPPNALTGCRTLCVAGGGGGGADTGGGGGAGGYLEATDQSISGAQTIIVGGGGDGIRVDYNNNCFHGGNGGNSSISGTSQTAIGGGGGGSRHDHHDSRYDGQDGGSGGGGSGRHGSLNGSGTAGQGYDGAISTNSHYCCGGGGASEAGTWGKDGSTQADGGDGKSSDILGTTYWWSGGGGGAEHSNPKGSGGKGGGGVGAWGAGASGGGSPDTNGVSDAEAAPGGDGNWHQRGGNAGKHTGGGGGGGSHHNAGGGGHGGSGMVAIKFGKGTIDGPSQVYDTSNTFTISNIPSGTGTVGKIYKGATAYTIHATQPTSNVVIKSTGTYFSRFTTSSAAYFTNAITVSATPDVGDNTIEDEPETTTTQVSKTIVFHDGTFADSDDPHSDGSITVAAINGHVYSDTATGTYSWGTLTSCVRTPMENNEHSTENWAYRHNSADPPTAGFTTYKWTPPGAITNGRTLVVAGGGGGGADMGGGGGAGGLLASTTTNIAHAEQTIQVGDGGARGYDNNSHRHAGGNGADSSISGPGITAIGGGGGATAHNYNDRPAGNGGSGGGGSGGVKQHPYTYGGARGTGTAGQGNHGANSGTHWYPAGGGGAGGMGYGADGQGGTNVRGDGGEGVEDDILGPAYWWAGGGGGASHSNHQSPYAGHGGKGGGGGGAHYHSSSMGNPLVTNDENGLTKGEVPTSSGSSNVNSGGSGGKHTGGGGGGSEYDANSDPTKMRGGRGGSGIVVIKFQATKTETSIAGSTAIAPAGATVDAPSLTLDATTEAATPTLDLDFTASMTNFPRNLKRYNSITSSSIGARFNRTESKKKRVHKSINTDKFSIELTANNMGDSSSSTSTLPVTVVNSGAGTQYTSGWTTGSTSSFVVPSDAPNALYYYCQNHDGMGGSISVSSASTTTHTVTVGSSSAGTQYTNGWTASGTPGSSGGINTFIAPSDAPNTLYYYCGNHSGMGGAINMVSASGTTTFAVTVQSVSGYYGSSNKYFIDGTQQATISLVRGKTYTFNNNASGSHPMYFATSSDGTTYTSGVTNGGTSSVTFAVPLNAPSTLYYKCGVHGGMGGTINILGPTASPLAVTVAGGKFVIGGVSQATLQLVRGETYVFNQENSSNGTHPLRLSETSNGTHVSGGSGFYIGGTQRPTLTMVRGNTYTFDQTNASNGSHVLQIATTSDGTQYTTGYTTGTFVVPLSAPDTLYYKSSTTAGMGGLINITGSSTSAFVVTAGGGKFSIGGVEQASLSVIRGLTYTFDQTDSSNSTHVLLLSSTSDGTRNTGVNKYYISGVETSTLTFIRGNTYTFDQSDSTNTNHPIRLSATSNGTHASGSQYTSGWTTTGTPGSSGASSQFVVPANAPSTLYYYCQHHSGMGGASSINVADSNSGIILTYGTHALVANATVSGEYTIATNFDGTTSNLYVNGALISQTTPTIASGAKTLKIGEDYNGFIKNFKFWNLAKMFFAPGLLDSYSLYNDTDKIASAYGFRLLFKEYTGAHAKIKRSSDNAEVDVTFDMNGDIKTPANFTTWKGSDTLYVMKWYDQSGRGLDVTPTNSSTPPVLENNLNSGHFSGKWHALFDGAGSDQELKIDNYTNIFGVSSAGQQKYTIFCSTHWSGGTSNDTLFAIGRTADNRNVAFHPNNGGSFNHYHYGADVTGTGISDETSFTLCLRYAGGGSNSTNMKQWFDTTLQSGSGSTSGGLDLENNYPLRIGGYSPRGSSHYYEGRIWNFIALRTDRTDSEVTDIIGKLNTY